MPQRLLDPFERSLYAALADDPWEATVAIREALGEGWLLSHLWDLIRRSNMVPPAPMPGSQLDCRDHFMLQYSKALGACPVLWQISVAYATELSMPLKPKATSKQWLKELLLQQVPRHTFALRKASSLCERLELEDIAQQLLISYFAACHKRIALRSEAPQPLLADKAGNLALRHEIVASASLNETHASLMTRSKSYCAKDYSGCPKSAIYATSQLAALLRAASPPQYSGPSWLPSFFELVQLLRQGASRLLCAQAQLRVLQLVNNTKTPQSILFRLVRVFAATALPERRLHTPPRQPMADLPLAEVRHTLLTKQGSGVWVPSLIRRPLNPDIIYQGDTALLSFHPHHARTVPSSSVWLRSMRCSARPFQFKETLDARMQNSFAS